MSLPAGLPQPLWTGNQSLFGNGCKWPLHTCPVFDEDVAFAANFMHLHSILRCGRKYAASNCTLRLHTPTMKFKVHFYQFGQVNSKFPSAALCTFISWFLFFSHWFQLTSVWESFYICYLLIPLLPGSTSLVYSSAFPLPLWAHGGFTWSFAMSFIPSAPPSGNLVRISSSIWFFNIRLAEIPAQLFWGAFLPKSEVENDH